MSQQIQRNIERVSAWWCNLMHPAARWPIHGYYECASCGRRYPVPWDQHASAPTGI